MVKKVKIDLSSMYKHFSWRSASASDILKSIISNIDVDKTHELVLLVNITPDIGLIIEGNDEIVKRIIDADDVEDEVERIAEEIARETGKDVILIELFNGYEWAYAVVK